MGTTRSESRDGLPMHRRAVPRVRAEAVARRQLVELRALEHELLASLAFLEGCRPCDAHDHPKAACGGCARPQAMDTTKLITGIAQQ